MTDPSVLVMLDTYAAWSRGVLRGFMEHAHERGWILVHYHPDSDLEWLVRNFTPAAAVLGLDSDARVPDRFPPCPTVLVNMAWSGNGVASVCLDEDKIGELAFSHLASRGLKNVTVFRFTDAPFAVMRDRAFSASASGANANVAPGWWVDDAEPPRSQDDPAAIIAWLRGLPKPCGVFTCCDAWGRVLARYARIASLRIPEDIALVGVDNDTIECELAAPALSSVAVPWQSMGRSAATLVHRALAGKSVGDERIVVPPTGIVARRSSDVLAIDDALVLRAVGWIREHAGRRLTVPMVARGAAASRQRLERRFRGVLGRSVLEEIRRAHVEIAKHLLSSTSLGLPEIAKRSGFTNAALLSVAFRREVGLPPGNYRRALRKGVTED